jgi:hypothetical protein
MDTPTSKSRFVVPTVVVWAKVRVAGVPFRVAELDVVVSTATWALAAAALRISRIPIMQCQLRFSVLVAPE